MHYHAKWDHFATHVIELVWECVFVCVACRFETILCSRLLVRFSHAIDSMHMCLHVDLCACVSVEVGNRSFSNDVVVSFLCCLMPSIEFCTDFFDHTLKKMLFVD